MPCRRVRFPWLPVMVLFAFAAVLSRAEKASIAAGVTPTAIAGLGKGTASLAGPWQFHVGDNPVWATPYFDDSNWEQLSAQKTWGRQGHTGYTGFAWYRLHLALSAAPGTEPNFSALFGFVDDAYEVYWNGNLIGRSGTLPPHPVWPVIPPARIFELAPGQSGVLAVRVWKAPLKSFDSGKGGGFWEPPVVGGPEGIANFKAQWDYQWLRSNQLEFGLNSFYALVGVLSLLGWLRDRTRSLLFWIACFALCPVMHFLLVGLNLPLPANLVTGLIQPLFGIEDVSLWFLLLLVLQLQDNRALTRLTQIAAILMLAVSGLDGLLAIFGWASAWAPQVQVVDAILTVFTTLLELTSLVLVGFAVYNRRRLDSTRWLVAIFAFLTEMISESTVALSQGSRFTHWTLGSKLRGPLFNVFANPVSALTLSSTLLLLSIVYAVYRSSVEVSRRQTALEQEFKSAREVQQVLIPETLPTVPGFALTSAYRPAQEVGGDFFQIIPLESGSTLIVLGDVSGKGLRAAMAVSLIVGVVHSLAESNPSPARLLAHLNRRLSGRLQGGFTTCVALRLDPGGVGMIASAGHPGPFLNDREFTLPGALPLGMAPATTYQEFPFFLRVNDHLCLFTDGLLEARSPSGEIFSFDRLKALFATRPSAAQATEAAVTFGQDDDITVVTLTRLSVGKESTAVFTASRLAPI